MIALFLALQAHAIAPPAECQPAPTYAIYLEQANGKGQTPYTFEGKPIYLAPKPLLTAADMEKIELGGFSGQNHVYVIRLTKRGRAHMRNATGKELGRHMIDVLGTQVLGRNVVKAKVDSDALQRSVDADLCAH